VTFVGAKRIRIILYPIWMQMNVSLSITKSVFLRVIRYYETNLKVL